MLKLKAATKAHGHDHACTHEHTVTESNANSEASLNAAKAKIQSANQRVTNARVQVLAVLLNTKRALSHTEIESLLPAMHADRVTLYRVLDWLTQQGLAHKVSGQDRAWLFSADASHDSQHQHAHFACQCCGQVVCLDEMMPSVSFTLPHGYFATTLEVTLHGTCPSCTEKH